MQHENNVYCKYATPKNSLRKTFYLLLFRIFIIIIMLFVLCWWCWLSHGIQSVYFWLTTIPFIFNESIICWNWTPQHSNPSQFYDDAGVGSSPAAPYFPPWIRWKTSHLKCLHSCCSRNPRKVTKTVNDQNPNKQTISGDCQH